MPRFSVVITAVLALASLRVGHAAGAASGFREVGAGLWASAAQRPATDVAKRPSAVTAPNGKAAIVYTGNGVYLRDEKKTTLLQEVNEPPTLSEVLWAPDSRAFVVTASDGGLVGTWHAHFYFVDADGRAVSRNIGSLVSRDAQPYALCDGSEEVNVGAAGWLRDSNELLVIAQVPPHSSCANMGALIGFRIDVKTWTVEKTVDERTLRTKFAAFLGNRLKSRTRA